MPELTPEQQAAGIFLDANGNPTWPDGTPALNQPSDPRGILDVLAPGNTRLTVQAYPEQTISNGTIVTNWVDDSGNFLNGPPDENGMGTIDVDQFGKLATLPNSYAFGPGFAGQGAVTYENVGGPFPENRTPLDPPQWFGEGTPQNNALDYSGGGADSSIPLNWEDYKSRNTSTGGGFFTADDLFGIGKVPFSFQSGSNLPSTNNWRLLPGQWRDPRFVMRQGHIIDLWTPPTYQGTSIKYASGSLHGVPSALGPAAHPGFNFSAWGWPGDMNGWSGMGYYWSG